MQKIMFEILSIILIAMLAGVVIGSLLFTPKCNYLHGEAGFTTLSYQGKPVVDETVPDPDIKPGVIKRPTVEEVEFRRLPKKKQEEIKEMEKTVEQMLEEDL